MLASKDATTNIAVKNLEIARKFYEDTLGLKKVGDQDDHVIVFKSGNSRIFVYRSEFAGTNKATTLTWVVGDELAEIVLGLNSKGVKFEHYDMPGMKREGDIHLAGDMKVAWFKDPEGNILSLSS